MYLSTLLSAISGDDTKSIAIRKELRLGDDNYKICVMMRNPESEKVVNADDGDDENSIVEAFIATNW